MIKTVLKNILAFLPGNKNKKTEKSTEKSTNETKISKDNLKKSKSEANLQRQDLKDKPNLNSNPSPILNHWLYRWLQLQSVALYTLTVLIFGLILTLQATGRLAYWKDHPHFSSSENGTNTNTTSASQNHSQNYSYVYVYGPDQNRIESDSGLELRALSTLLLYPAGHLALRWAVLTAWTALALGHPLRSLFHLNDSQFLTSISAHLSPGYIRTLRLLTIADRVVWVWVLGVLPLLLAIKPYLVVVLKQDEIWLKHLISTLHYRLWPLVLAISLPPLMWAKYQWRAGEHSAEDRAVYMMEALKAVYKADEGDQLRMAKDSYSNLPYVIVHEVTEEEEEKEKAEKQKAEKQKAENEAKEEEEEEEDEAHNSGWISQELRCLRRYRRLPFAYYLYMCLLVPLAMVWVVCAALNLTILWCLVTGRLNADPITRPAPGMMVAGGVKATENSVNYRDQLLLLLPSSQQQGLNDSISFSFFCSSPNDSFSSTHSHSHSDGSEWFLAPLAQALYPRNPLLRLLTLTLAGGLELAVPLYYGYLSHLWAFGHPSWVFTSWLHGTLPQGGVGALNRMVALVSATTLMLPAWAVLYPAHLHGFLDHLMVEAEAEDENETRTLLESGLILPNGGLLTILAVEAWVGWRHLLCSPFWAQARKRMLWELVERYGCACHQLDTTQGPLAYPFHPGCRRYACSFDRTLRRLLLTEATLAAVPAAAVAAPEGIARAQITLGTQQRIQTALASLPEQQLRCWSYEAKGVKVRKLISSSDSVITTVYASGEMLQYRLVPYPVNAPVRPEYSLPPPPPAVIDYGMTRFWSVFFDMVAPI